MAQRRGHRARKAHGTLVRFVSEADFGQVLLPFHNRLSPIKIPENVGDFRLMNRAAVDALKQLPERNRFMKGLFAWIGFNTVTIDYVRNPRSSGASKFSGWKLWNFALEGFTSFSTAPLKLWTYVGASAQLEAPSTPR
jgi:hypothetical protein